MKRKNRDQEREIRQIVEQGIHAARLGHKEEAERLLRQAVALDPRNERAWLWLSAVVEGIDAQRECLQRVLAINPTNSFARSGIAFLGHLREGYEYLAARAPWMAGLEDERTPIDRLPSQQCPRCGAKNPGWAYLCSRCSAVLQATDVRQAVQKELRKASSTIAIPWAGAAILDAELAFGREIALASPLRSVINLVLGATALNLARGMGGLFWALFSLKSRGLSPNLLNQMAVVFLQDLVLLVIGALIFWIILASLTRGIARSRGGRAPARVHNYLVAVALSAWMAVGGTAGVIFWAIPLLAPRVPLAWAIAGLGGVSFFYALTLLLQAIRMAHSLKPGGEILSIGLSLLGITVSYLLLTALAPPGLRDALWEGIQLLLFPLGSR